MKTRTLLPRIIERFFGDGSTPKETPEGYVYFGPNTDEGFDLIPWHTKIKGDKYKRQGEEHRTFGNDLAAKHYHVFVSVSEVASFALGSDSYTTDTQKEEVREYVEEAGIPIIDYPKIKYHQPRRHKKKKEASVLEIEKKQIPRYEPFQKTEFKEGVSLKEQDPEIKIICETTIELVETTTLRSLSGEELKLEPGKYPFALIDSPHRYEKSCVRWLVLKDQLPKIFGKSVAIWEMFLGYNPLDTPPAQ